MTPIDASKARALRRVSSATLATVRRRAGEGWTRWCDDWAPALRDAEISAVDVHHAMADSATTWRPLWTSEIGTDAQVWLALPRRAEAVLSNHWFGTGTTGDLAESVASRALEALVASLREALQPAMATAGAQGPAPVDSSTSVRSSIPPVHGSAWSGALALEWTITDARIRLHLGPDRVSAFSQTPGASIGAPARAPLDGLVPALRDVPIRLRAEMSGIKISLAELASLRPGDALRLDHRLDTPIALVTADGNRICDAAIGERDGRRALRLLAPRPQATAARP